MFASETSWRVTTVTHYNRQRLLSFFFRGGRTLIHIIYFNPFPDWATYFRGQTLKPENEKERERDALRHFLFKHSGFAWRWYTGPSQPLYIYIYISRLLFLSISSVAAESSIDDRVLSVTPSRQHCTPSGTRWTDSQLYTRFVTHSLRSSTFVSRKRLRFSGSSSFMNKKIFQPRLDLFP